MTFPAEYDQIIGLMDNIDPIRYGQSRNFVDGSVTRLSPYISRGVISTKQVMDHVLAKGYKLDEIQTFVRELCWRDYFQRVMQEKDVNADLQHVQEDVTNHEVPVSVLNASTSIEAIDRAIEQLYETGYMHNHSRLYTAFLVCNVARSHWLNPARWLYYHLIDGDWASNACSWQWVAGSNSKKKYITNQENINHYTSTSQAGTYLDVPYENIGEIPIPADLIETIVPELKTKLPQPAPLSIEPGVATFIYNYYNLDPRWHKGERGNRILLLEPDHFNRYPVADRNIDFAVALGGNIPGLQVYVGSFNALLNEFPLDTIVYKEHPFNRHYTGTCEPRDWIQPAVTGYFPSFFGYWKRVNKAFSKR